MSVRLLTTAQKDDWESAMPAELSAFGSLGFARAQERSDQAEPRLLVAEAGPSRVAYPLQLRPLTDLPFVAEVDFARWDSSSPPFTGPMANGLVDSDRVSAMEAEIAKALQDEGVVAEFVHLHPWRAEAAIVGGGEPDREIVWVDLTLDPDELWRESYSKACRKNVNRAECEGVTVRAAADSADIAEFHRIYIATMERNRAGSGYFLRQEYFQAIFEEMPGSARFALAEHEGRVIAATLYLHDSEDVYSYLGGADHAYQELRPTNAVVHDTVGWGRDAGKRRLVLGGGYAPDDGIMRFKSGFSPLRATFQVARRVHLPGDYEALAGAWARHHDGAEPTGYFPAYRAR